MQFNSGSSTIQPQAGAPTHTCGRNAHQNTFIPYTNQNRFLEFPPDYITVIPANTIAQGAVAENAQNRSHANELPTSVPYNLTIHPQHPGQVAHRAPQTSAEYQGAQVPGDYPVASNPPNTNDSHSQYPTHSTVVHQGPSIISGITIGQILAFNNPRHSAIPFTNSNLRNTPPRQENNASRLADNVRTSHLPNVCRDIPSQNENKPVCTGADLSMFNPKTPNILRAEPYCGINSIQNRQHIGIPMPHSNGQNITQKLVSQTDHCPAFTHNTHNTRPLVNANRHNLSQAPYHPENVFPQQQQNSGDTAASSAANFNPLIEPVQEYFDDPDAEGSTDDEYYESINMSTDSQSDLQVNASHNSLNVHHRPSERKSEAVQYIEKKYGIQLQSEDYELLKQGQSSLFKTKNNVDLHGDKQPRSTTRLGDHRAPFVQGSSKNKKAKQAQSSRKRQREEEVGTARTARPSKRPKGTSPSSSSAQPANSGSPLPPAAPIEADTSSYDGKCPEEAFFVPSFDGLKCRYRDLETGKVCARIITNPVPRGRYRHLATHARQEQRLVNKGWLREEDAVLLTRLPKVVVRCRVKGCAWRGQVWRTDNVRKTHEKQSHPEFYVQRLGMKEKEKWKSPDVVEEFEKSEFESSEPES